MPNAPADGQVWGAGTPVGDAASRQVGESAQTEEQPPAEEQTVGRRPVADGEEDALLHETRALMSGIEAELAAIGRALERLESGGYGRCEVCGASLSDELLAKSPAAERCAEHAG